MTNIKRKILVAEDSKTGRAQITKHLSDSGFDVVAASNGKEALSLFERNTFPVVLTDLVMPEMEGGELIEKLKSIEPEIIFLVLSSHEKPEIIIDIMKKGVFDYIMKPVQINDLIIKIEKAFHYAWLNKQRHIEEREQFKKSLIANLHRSFNQGAGIGTHLSIMKMVVSKAETMGDNYLIDKNIYKLIEDNQQATELIIKKIYELEQVLENRFDTSKSSVQELAGIIEACIDAMQVFAPINRNSLIFKAPDKKVLKKQLMINIDRIKETLLELIINAMKFSCSGSDIKIDISSDENDVILSITNTVPDDSLGIPQKFETEVFEPFFRMNRFVFEEYKTLDFGLGLSFAESIIYMHDGTIRLHNMFEQLNGSENQQVICSVILPVIKE